LFFLIRSKPKLDTRGLEELNQLKSENEELKISLAKAQERTENIKSEQDYLRKELNAEREKLSDTLRSLESSRAYLQAQKEKIDEQKSEIQNNQEKFNKDFELIASRILEEKSIKFTEHSRVNLDLIIKPLRENLKTFEDKVDKVYKAESDERNILRGHINQLIEQSSLMNQETKNLTKALKGDSKKQGNWGEMVLERVLERSGLVKNQEYRIQASHQSSDGRRFKPDVEI
jgi:DNA recombination protein RmuC